MRIRAIASELRDSIASLPAAKRASALQRFLSALHARRMQKLLPRIVAALATLETEAGAPPVTVRVAEATTGLPSAAEVTIDPSVLAGASVRRGDLLTDTTLSTQLSRLTQALKT